MLVWYYTFYKAERLWGSLRRLILHLTWRVFPGISLLPVFAGVRLNVASSEFGFLVKIK